MKVAIMVLIAFFVFQHVTFSMYGKNEKSKKEVVKGVKGCLEEFDHINQRPNDQCLQNDDFEKELSKKGYVISHGGNFSHKFYDEKKMPIQGFKVHLTAKTDQKSLNEIANWFLPQLRQKKISHKIVSNLEVFKDMAQYKDHRGKFITIYPKNIKELSEIKKMVIRAQKEISSDHFEEIKGEMALVKNSNIAFLRYGIFLSIHDDIGLLRVDQKNNLITKKGEKIKYEGSLIDALNGKEINLNDLNEEKIDFYLKTILTHFYSKKGNKKWKKNLKSKIKKIAKENNIKLKRHQKGQRKKIEKAIINNIFSEDLVKTVQKSSVEDQYGKWKPDWFKFNIDDLEGN